MRRATTINTEHKETDIHSNKENDMNGNKENNTNDTNCA